MEIFTLWVEKYACQVQRVMDRILTRLDFVQYYIDDIVVYNDTVEEH
jgi:hypothetical protein